MVGGRYFLMHFAFFGAKNWRYMFKSWIFLISLFNTLLKSKSTKRADIQVFNIIRKVASWEDTKPSWLQEALLRPGPFLNPWLIRPERNTGFFSEPPTIVHCQAYSNFVEFDIKYAHRIIIVCRIVQPQLNVYGSLKFFNISSSKSQGQDLWPYANNTW